MSREKEKKEIDGCPITLCDKIKKTQKPKEEGTTFELEMINLNGKDVVVYKGTEDPFGVRSITCKKVKFPYHKKNEFSGEDNWTLTVEEDDNGNQKVKIISMPIEKGWIEKCSFLI